MYYHLMKEQLHVIKSVDLKSMEEGENQNLLMENTMIELAWIF